MQTTQISNIQLEGCSFDGSRLTHNDRDSPSVCTLPTCAVAWVDKEAPPLSPAPQERITLPLYYGRDRQAVVCCLDLPCASGSHQQWILCGVALFLKN